MASEFEFKIDGWTPATIPQSRLGEYLIEVAKLYGEAGNVHFERMRRGSVVLVSRVEDTAAPKVQRRLEEVRRGHAPKEAVDAFKRIDDMLALDNAVGVLRGRGEERGLIISFPGRERRRPSEYGGIREQGFLEGELIRIGGKGKVIHLALQSLDTVYSSIETDRETARRLGSLILGPIVRLHGTGTWGRTEDGLWHLDRFVVTSFEEIADVSLADALDSIRAIGGSEWHLEADPFGTLEGIRMGVGRPRS